MSDLPQHFPRLTEQNHTITSSRTPDYNCIAWAAQDTGKWWWPDAAGDDYWPSTAPREETLEAFETAYGTLGYLRCDNGDLEAGFEKIAVFVDASGMPTHAARQLTTGRWTSKCGKLEDIEHALDVFKDTAYGEVGMVLKRPS